MSEYPKSLPLETVVQPRVFIFLDTMPQRQGSGASLRYYSNIRAYLDLGYRVDVIQIAGRPDNSSPSDDLKPVTWHKAILNAPSHSLFGKLMFRLGIVHRHAVAYFFPKHHLVRREVESRLEHFPKAIYHFEGESIANIVPWLNKSVRAIWSLHDLPSTVSEAVIKIACEAEHRAPTVPEKRERRFAHGVEQVMARRAPLILTIGKHDCERLRNEWGCKSVEYLPMSIPGDGEVQQRNSWLQNGHLRLLHLGRVSHLPSFRSLEFLFEQVFPRLTADTIGRIWMDIVGRVDSDTRANKIMKLATQYQNVSFHGYVENIIPYYRTSDVQVVAATDASGLRTRTIESFANSLPVLSTTVGALGIEGLRPDENILIADDAAEFAARLEQLTRSPETLQSLSRTGRATNLEHYSSRVVAARLSAFLKRLS